MTDKIALTVISAERQIYNGEVESVLVPGMLGDFMVLSEHSNCISTIRPGYLKFSDGESLKNTYFVSGGIVEVIKNKVSILVDLAISTNDITKEKISELVLDIDSLLLETDIKNKDKLELRKNDLEEARKMA